MGCLAFTAISAPPVRPLDNFQKRSQSTFQVGNMAPAWLAKLYAVGDSTIETYFKRQLAPPSSAASGASSQGPWQSPVDVLPTDIVAAAIKVYKADIISNSIPRGLISTPRP